MLSLSNAGCKNCPETSLANTLFPSTNGPPRAHSYLCGHPLLEMGVYQSAHSSHQWVMNSLNNHMVKTSLNTNLLSVSICFQMLIVVAKALTRCNFKHWNMTGLYWVRYSASVFSNLMCAIVSHHGYSQDSRHRVAAVQVGPNFITKFASTNSLLFICSRFGIKDVYVNILCFPDHVSI